jgi:tRNA1(Val) A37 N6-methylase TrmN6
MSLQVPGQTGLVRPPRRPPGWHAPGPRPAGDPGVGPRPGEDLCHLAGDWRILQRLDGHRWSLDDLVTAWFAACHAGDAPPETVLDLGCGIGAVLMLLAWRFPAARVVGIEAQALSVDLARRSLAWNGAGPRCRVLLGDLRDAAVDPGPERFALVTGTPPYLRPGSATPPSRVQCGPCHLEYRGGLEDYCAAAARHLAPGGRFVVCAAAAHVARVQRAADAAGLGVVRRRDVIPREGKPALFSVWAMRRAADAAPSVVEPPLVVRDRAGRRTDAFRAVRAEMGMPP